VNDLVLVLDEVALVLGGARVLDRISYAIGSGERLAVVGANGSGKSVLARIAMGLSRPTAGAVSLFGQDLARTDADTLRRLRSRTGVVLQGGGLIGDLSADDNLKLAVGAIRPGVQARLGARIDRAIINFGLEQATGRRASELSAGERRRLELARAFLREPDLLILDDPFEGADGPTAVDLEARLLKALRRRTPALLLLTHQQGLAERLDAKVVRLSSGRVT
jgi:ABC-type multidrug transport system ATPase subunit